MTDRELDLLPSQRELFEIPPDVTFLNCANMSPQLKAVTEAGIAAVKRKQTPWETAPADWFSGAEDLRVTAARLMGADAEGIALVPAVSYGIAVAAANVTVRPGQNIVLLHDQFPSNVYAWRRLAEARSALIKTVRKSAPDAWTDALLDAIDENTAVVAVPNCHWTDGSLVDLVAVGARARAARAALVVDASQSLGALPIDVSEVQPDFLVSVGYKWQLGPYGLGYLYVAPRWREGGRPIEESWLTKAGAEDFAALVNYSDAYRPGARRFDMGGYPQFVLAPMAKVALTQILAWGIDRVRASIGRLTGLIAREAEALGYQVLPADKRAGHMLGLRLPHGIPDELPGTLTERRVYVSVRGDSIRVAPHVYNGEEDVERFLAVVREFV
ncbi:MAG: aminotransferase class V-fold PLP-dependent enzyme [Gemmatimonadetes bacterium]|nr:aminotransferase class V-fold PLP-dependent enzyme [Gemmatimonadota bacterium]